MIGKLLAWAVHSQLVVLLLACALACVGSYAFLHVNVGSLSTMPVARIIVHA